MMTRTQYNVRRRTMRLGGDFWNHNQVLAKAFADPHVTALHHVAPLLTGLWADVVVETPDGLTKRRLFA